MLGRIPINIPSSWIYWYIGDWWFPNYQFIGVLTNLIEHRCWKGFPWPGGKHCRLAHSCPYAGTSERSWSYMTRLTILCCPGVVIKNYPSESKNILWITTTRANATNKQMPYTCKRSSKIMCELGCNDIMWMLPCSQGKKLNNFNTKSSQVGAYPGP